MVLNSIRKIFIDCGSFDGCSIRKYKDKFDTKNVFEYFAFEPNPNLKKYHPQDNTTFYDTFVSNEEDPSTFYVCGTSGGSTEIKLKSDWYIKKTKESFGVVEEIILTPVRLSKFIMENFSKEDYIVLKMDIEGSEYKVLEDCVSSGALKYVNEVLIEWHLNGRTDWPEPYEFIKEFKSFCALNKITVDSNWNAMHKPYLLEQNCSEFEK